MKKQLLFLLFQVRGDQVYHSSKVFRHLSSLSKKAVLVIYKLASQRDLKSLFGMLVRPLHTTLFFEMRFLLARH
jgi:hypothetical protein